MLILWGRHDFVFDMTYYDHWRRYFPGAAAHVFDSAGHYLFEDEPEATLALIRRFISRRPCPHEW
jgi:pimeloyl-ACP methyl ester carboxylesterase